MTQSRRERLPNRRSTETFNLNAGGLNFTCSFSRFADGRVGEVFINNHKTGSCADVNAADAAIAVSFALQHAADLQAIARALCRDARDNASGPLGAALDAITERDAQ